MRRSIIVGVDCSPEATDAARVGAALARRLDRNLVLARVVDEPPASPFGSRRPSEALRRRVLQSATDLLIAVATEIGEAGARKRVAVFRGTGDQPDGGLANLVREEDADLLVVGSHGRGPLGGKRFPVPAAVESLPRGRRAGRCGKPLRR